MPPSATEEESEAKEEVVEADRHVSSVEASAKEVEVDGGFMSPQMGSRGSTARFPRAAPLVTLEVVAQGDERRWGGGEEDGGAEGEAVPGGGAAGGTASGTDVDVDFGFFKKARALLFTHPDPRLPARRRSTRRRGARGCGSCQSVAPDLARRDGFARRSVVCTVLCYCTVVW